MQNILVTGGAGFIGSNFIRNLLEAVPTVRIVNLDALTYAGLRENLDSLPDPERHVFVEGDICDQALITELLHKYEVESIVHFAAESHVDRSIVDPSAFVQTNVVGTFCLLEAARQCWLEQNTVPREKIRFHHVSTDEVFGSLEPDQPASTEASPYAPNSPYAASKAASDHLVRSYGRTYGLPVTLTNCSNVYGPRQFPEKLIPLAILRILERRTIPLYGNGRQIRDWLYVEDQCEALRLVLDRGVPGEAYNIGGGNGLTNLTVIEMLCDIFDEVRPDASSKSYRRLITFVPDRPGHDLRYALSTAKVEAHLGWKPRHGLRDGLLLTIRWYLDHPQWIEAVRNQTGFSAWLEKMYGTREL